MGATIQYQEMDLDGNSWEELIDKLLRIKYKDNGYQYVPARDDGDCGIEGFTNNGIVFQCYFPDGEYSPKDLYGKLQIKMRDDIQKIIDYQSKLIKLGVTNIKEWHFIIPKYEDKRIIEYSRKKEAEIIKAKQERKLSIVDDNFKIYIKLLDDYIPEMSILIKTNKDYKYQLPKIKEVDFSSCDSLKKQNIFRKIMTLRDNKEDEKTKKMINMYVDFYLKGIEMLNEVREFSPELYEEIIKLENTYRIDLELKCDSNTDNAINQEIFREILAEFEQKLKEEFEDLLHNSDIGELKQEMIGKWLAECPLDFAD